MIELKETVLLAGARYAHTRNTGMPFAIVSEILRVWDALTPVTKEQLYRESFEAQYCAEDWKLVQDRYEKDEETY